METIAVMHYKSAPDTMKKVRFSHEHPLQVHHLEGLGEDFPYGVCGYAVTKTGERLPVSKLYARGHTWTTCVNDDTGERWA